MRRPFLVMGACLAVTVGTLAASMLAVAQDAQRAPVVARVGEPADALSPKEAPVEAAGAPQGRAVLIGMRAGVPGPIPPVAADAYQRAASILGEARRGCGLTWPILAGVGWVESAHGEASGSSLGPDGGMTVPMFGPASSGSDSDGGAIDEMAIVDRGVGPMQFMPALWGTYGVDSDSNGTRDPQNIHDAALALAVFLCTGTLDLTKSEQVSLTLARFNGVSEYASRVLAAAEFYRAQPVAVGSSDLLEPVVVVLETSPSESPSVLIATPSPSSSATRTTAATTSAAPKPTPGPTAETSPAPSTTTVTPSRSRSRPRRQLRRPRSARRPRRRRRTDAT